MDILAASYTYFRYWAVWAHKNGNFSFPCALNEIYSLEKIRRRGARWVTSKHSRYDGLSDIITIS